MNEASKQAVVVGLSFSPGKDQPRTTVRDMLFDRGGVVGDAHRGAAARQVSLLDWGLLELRAREQGEKPMPGQQRENLAVSGLNQLPLRLCDCLELGHVALEVTSLGAPFVHREEGCAFTREGVFARVRRGGAIRLGAHLKHRPRTVALHVITLSDRASRGAYEDESGPRAEAVLREWGDAAGWGIEVSRTILPDDADALEQALTQAQEQGPGVIITTGGTGAGPRDITPEVVTRLLDKELPGIMEHVRLKYGQQKPLARLSRSVAGTTGETPVFALPGSPRAVEEYLREITPLLEHLILVARGIDPH